MTAAVAGAVVRTEDGAILGPDYRRMGLVRAEYTVPGRIPADGVQPGDTIRAEGLDLVVLKAWRDRLPGSHVRLVTRARLGTEIVLERDPRERVEVVGVGAFDR